MKSYSLIIGNSKYTYEITQTDVVIVEKSANAFICYNIGSEMNLHTLEYVLHYVSSPIYASIFDHVFIVSNNTETLELCFNDERCETVYVKQENIIEVPPHLFKPRSEYIFDRAYHPEMGYLSLVKNILKSGELRADRTGIGTRSLFGAQLKFNLQDGFPLLTTKRVFFRAVVEELLWFLRGDTDANILKDNGIHIWDDNATREFLDGRNLTEYPEGVLGPVYGFQWRHWGAEYDPNLCEGGIDQLQKVMDQIKSDPTSRRIIMSAWNVGDLEKMALPPCHILTQFQVSSDKKLNCSMYQRSADVGLGVPFNIASYALLTHLIAHSTGLEVGTLTLSFGDVHIYLNHIEGLKEQITRKPRKFPILELLHDEDQIRQPWEWSYQDIELHEYKPHKIIKLDMAI